MQLATVVADGQRSPSWSDPAHIMASMRVMIVLIYLLFCVDQVRFRICWRILMVRRVPRTPHGAQYPDDPV